MEVQRLSFIVVLLGFAWHDLARPCVVGDGVRGKLLFVFCTCRTRTNLSGFLFIFGFVTPPPPAAGPFSRGGGGFIRTEVDGWTKERGGGGGGGGCVAF